MKNCIQCGAEAADDVVHCTGCGRAFSFVSSSVLNTAPVMADVTERPDGKTLKTLGTAAMGIGVMMFVISYVNMGSDFESINPIAIALKWVAALFGAALGNFGLLLWLVGHIIYAISFLPGKDEN